MQKHKTLEEDRQADPHQKEFNISSIRPIDLRFVDDLVDFVRGRGYVLDFSDASFSQFFYTELKIDIDDPKFEVNGRSKGKRLRNLLQTCSDATAVRVLKALWEYRSEYLVQTGVEDSILNAQPRFQALILRLSGGTASTNNDKNFDATTSEVVSFEKIKSDLMIVAALSPHSRGYAFEAFLKDLFNAFNLSAEEPFRLRGEQIDGSFQLGSDTYLVEAKWQGLPIGVAELHTFHGKIEQKAAWTRGLFVSNSGFTDEGLTAFGRGKRVICMDGLDLYDMLDREIPLTQVLAQKIRRAAETGSPFVRVRDLFPR